MIGKKAGNGGYGHLFAQDLAEKGGDAVVKESLTGG